MVLFLSLELMRDMQMETETEIWLIFALFMIIAQVGCVGFCNHQEDVINECCTNIMTRIDVSIYFVWFLTPSIRARMAS